MGMVVLAHHLEFDERVAESSFLLPQALASQEAVAQVRAGGARLSKIKNEHVARTLDISNLRTALPTW